MTPITDYFGAQERLRLAAQKRAHFVAEEPLRAADAAVIEFEKKLAEREQLLAGGGSSDTTIDFDVQCAKGGVHAFTERMKAEGYTVKDLKIDLPNYNMVLLNIKVSKNPPKKFAVWPYGETK